MARQSRIQRLYELAAYLHRLPSGTELTATEWGRAVGLRRTPYLMSLITEIQQEGLLHVRYVSGVYPVTMRLFSMPDYLYEERIRYLLELQDSGADETVDLPF